MKDRALYRQKKQAQLDEWKAEINLFKARASMASADAQLKIIKHIKILEKKIDENKAKLSELSNSSEEANETIKQDVESAWDSLKSAMKEASAKFKESK